MKRLAELGLLQRTADLYPKKNLACLRWAPGDVTKWSIDCLSEKRTQSFVSTERQEPILRMQAKQMMVCLSEITECLPWQGEYCKQWGEKLSSMRCFYWIIRKQQNQPQFAVNVFSHISLNNYLLIIEGTMIYETASLDKTLNHWVTMISISE